MKTKTTTIRDAVRAAMTARGLAGPAALCKLMPKGKDGKPVISESHVYDFLAGRKDWTSAYLDVLFGVLELEVREME